MLWIAFWSLLVLWLFGTVAGFVPGNTLHLLLVAAFGAALLRIIQEQQVKDKG